MFPSNLDAKTERLMSYNVERALRHVYSQHRLLIFASCAVYKPIARAYLGRISSLLTAYPCRRYNIIR